MTFDFHLNPLAIIVAALSSFILGFIWYSFLFNKLWKKEWNVYTDSKPTTSQMLRSLGFNFFGTVLMVFMFSQLQQTTTKGVFVTVLWIWIGFYIPQDLNKISFQNKSWKLFTIDALFNLASLLVTAMVLRLFV